MYEKHLLYAKYPIHSMYMYQIVTWYTLTLHKVLYVNYILITLEKDYPKGQTGWGIRNPIRKFISRFSIK